MEGTIVGRALVFVPLANGVERRVAWGETSCFFMGECAFAVLVTFILNKAS